MKKLAITLSDDDIYKLEDIRSSVGISPFSDFGCCERSKSKEIAWLIRKEWERLQKERAAGYGPPCAIPRIIQFPVSGSA
jgi:hypothetical protein